MLLERADELRALDTVLNTDGQTNRQIAHGLYVTLKTVETHLAHVYAKLGISHRGELPAALAGENLGVPPDANRGPLAAQWGHHLSEGDPR